MSTTPTKSTIKLELSNNQAVHLWSMMVSYQDGTVNHLKALKIYKKDGTPNLLRKHYSEVVQEQIDNLALAKLISDHIESTADFSEVEEL